MNHAFSRSFAAVAVLVAGLAFALSAGAQTTAPAKRFVEFEDVVVKGLNLTVKQLDERDVHAADGQRLGDVDEVLVTPDGTIAALAVDVGGFLGINEKTVVVELGQVSLKGDKLTVALSKAEIEALPAWDDD
ncbi:MAG: PRC-barrel domain-containing protein [Pseudomonadota bacterium]